MEKRYKFRVLGKVQAKQSVKFANIGGFMRKYTPKEMTNYANLVKLCFMKEYPNHLPSELFEYMLEMKIDVFFEVPKSFSKKKKEQALKGEIRPTVKPDWDNISKNICDALNGVAYPDDKAIVSGTVNKYYAEFDYVNIEIKGFKNEYDNERDMRKSRMLA